MAGIQSFLSQSAHLIRKDQLMGTYKFDWQDVVHGHIEVEAESGVEAEQIFRKMKLQDRLNSSQIDADKDSLKIKFVDLGFDDLLTHKEWEDGLKQYT